MSPTSNALKREDQDQPHKPKLQRPPSNPQSQKSKIPLAPRENKPLNYGDRRLREKQTGTGGSVRPNAQKPKETVQAPQFGARSTSVDQIPSFRVGPATVNQPSTAPHQTGELFQQYASADMQPAVVDLKPSIPSLSWQKI